MDKNIPHDHPHNKSRTCRTCGEYKSKENFSLHKSKASYGGYQAMHHCKVCERERKLRSHLEKTYGLTLEKYNEMVDEQDNRCYLCGEAPSDVYGRLVVDHCHITGKVRKLLCRMCNIHLSRVEACPDYLNKVIEYLRKEF